VTKLPNTLNFRIAAIDTHNNFFVFFFVVSRAELHDFGVGGGLRLKQLRLLK
jgi:hypothetical protein